MAIDIDMVPRDVCVMVKAAGHAHHIVSAMSGRLAMPMEPRNRKRVEQRHQRPRAYEESHQQQDTSYESVTVSHTVSERPANTHGAGGCEWMWISRRDQGSGAWLNKQTESTGSKSTRLMA